MGGCKRIKEGKKEMRIPFNSKLCGCWLSMLAAIILSFSICFFFLLIPLTCCVLYLWKAARELRKEEKRRGDILTQNFVVIGCLCWLG